jgi:hypothetical protein
MFGEQFAILVVEGEFEGFGVDLDAVDEVGFMEQVEDWGRFSARQQSRTHTQGLRHKIEAWSYTTDMLKTLWAKVRQGKIELLEAAELPEGVRVLVTVLPDDEVEFWLQASQISLDAVWDNTEDDVYAQLLQV